ncbi:MULTISPECIES: transferrin-binding protein-like solute binding protein [unclassified Ruegeria]|uniref:transferrin-binding protein-like solute binding protein n=1 Tax=unclassified Ruegeria TaxID=2625375 RepID=UPI001489BC8C|nr:MULTISPECIES: transferrin-binding protein-like solute binding protein [unclassified Ruegeria]NOD62446.1 hypothetical protein [Ruegeria sp. HKCCD6109]NOD89730.1 hypothetical protein [Ruegeria sp. HKCCD4318]NOE14053.1 hypothetical protein [Ruegeria sp. HKCCD4318-2]NOG08010.1 hypothetical protein [Ruegeria sp. HKCCD4315]
MKRSFFSIRKRDPQEVSFGVIATTYGPGTNGEAYGVFYGPNAEEVGGTFQASGANGVSHIGSFGAD